MKKTIAEPMYMATRFFIWCKTVGAEPTEFDIKRWIEGGPEE